MKTKISSHLLAFVGIFFIIAAVFFSLQSRESYAVITDPTVTSLITSSKTIKGNSLYPVFKVIFSDAEVSENLQSVNVILNTSATADPGAITSDVLEDNRVYDGGWQIWKDSSNGTAGTFEQFTDRQLLLDSSTLNYGSSGAFTLNLDTDEPISDGDTFYVAVHTDDAGLPNSSSFTVSISGIATSGTTQPTFSTVTTSYLSLSSSSAQALRIEALDTTLTSGDRIKLTFNQNMDFSYISQYGLSYYIYQYNDSWYQNCFGRYDTTLAEWDDCEDNYSYTTTSDSITITLGSNPTVTTSNPVYYSLPTASGSWGWGSIRFDSTAPTLSKVQLITDAGSDGQANDIGDKIAFQFNEPINADAITPSNINTILAPSSGSYDGGGAKPTLTWWGSSILVVTLQNNLGTDLIGKTVTVSSEVKDIANNAYSSSSTPTISTTTLPPTASITCSDIDTANSWIDKNDIGASYILPSYDSSVTSDTDFHVDIYLVPENVGYASSLFRINSQTLSGAQSGTTYSFDGADSDYYLYYDSRTDFISIQNNNWSNIEYHSFEDNTNYIIYSVVSTDPHSSETSVSIPRPSETCQFTAESWDESTSTPWISESSPGWNSAIGSSNIPTNLSTFTLTWSEALNSTSAGELSNYSLKYDSDGDWIYDTATPLSSVSYDSENFVTTLTTTSTLQANVYYYLQVDNSVEDLFGTSVGSYASVWFQTGSTSDTTAPTVSSTNISATGVDPAKSYISITFSEDISALTISTSSATIDPAVANTSIIYDVSSTTLKYRFGSQPMAENTAYTFSLDGALITDLSGNYLDGDNNGSAGGDYNLSFTTGTLSTAKPQISWSTFDGYELQIGFDSSMKETDVEDSSKWTLECDDTVQSIWANTSSWDYLTYTETSTTNKLTITGLYCSGGASYTITAANSIRGGNNQTIDADYDSSSGTVTSSTSTGFGGSTSSSTYYSTYNPVWVYPRDPSAGATTDYYISFPISTALGDGYKIIIEWPAGFGLSNVTPKAYSCASYSDCSWNNRDINGSWNGLYSASGGTFDDDGVIRPYDLVTGVTCPGDSGCISNNNTDEKTTTMTLWMDYDNDGTRDSTAVTKSSDNIYVDFTGVVNPSTASEYNYSSDTGGYKVNIYTQKGNGTPVEGPLSSSAFAIVAAGTGTMSGIVTDDNGNAIAGATVSAYSWSGSSISKRATTDSNGTYTISGLQNGDWWPYTEPPSSGRYTWDWSNYSYSSQCTISSSNQTCTYNGSLKYLDYETSGGIVSDESLGGEGYSMWSYCSTNYSASGSSVRGTLDADGLTSYTLYADACDQLEIGLYPDWNWDAFVSQRETVSVTGNISGVNFNLTAADINLPFAVYDQDGNPLQGVSVGAWSESSDNWFSVWGQTGTDGTVTLKVVAGDYKCYASQWGYGNAEKFVDVEADGTLTPSDGCVFRFRERDSTIAGTATDEDGNPLQWASVSYKDSDGSTQWDSTDSFGDFLIYVPGGDDVTGTVSVSHWQSGGNIAPKSNIATTATAYRLFNSLNTLNSSFSVTRSSSFVSLPVVSDSTITGINFQYDPDSYGTISGTVTADDSGLQWTSIWGDEVSRSTGQRIGTWSNSWTNTDLDGNYTLKVPKNSATTCWNVSGWTMHHGELPTKTCLDISEGNLTGQNWDLGTLQTLTVTVSGAPSDVTTAYLDIQQTGSNTGIWRDITLVSGSGTASMDIWDGSYQAKLVIDGFGEFSPDSPNADGFSVSGANKSISFPLTSSVSSALSISGTVSDLDGNAIQDARVRLFDSDAGNAKSVKTAANGSYSLSVPAGTYTALASKARYSNANMVTITASGTYNFTLESAGSTISGTAYRNGVAVDGAWIIAKSDEKRASADSLGDGTFTAYVPDDDTLTWNLECMTQNGYRGTEQGVSDGTTGLTLNCDTQAVTLIGDQECKSAPPSQPMTLDDEAGTKAVLQMPADIFDNTSGNDSEAATLCVEPKAMPLTAGSDVDVFNTQDIKVTDSSGTNISNFKSDFALKFVYTKADIESYLLDGSIGACADLNTIQIGYWDKNTESWVNQPTTRTMKIKSSSSDTDFADAVYDTAVTNICDSTNATTQVSSFYYDYKITLRTNLDHLTTFGIIVPSDTTAPSAPAGLTATVGDGQIALDWDNNTESDLLEYTVYRSQSSTVQTINANQTSQVTSSAYTDTTAVNGTKYYYVVTASDRSGNESSASNTTYGTPTAAVDTTAPARPSNLRATAGNGSVSLTWNASLEDDFSKYNIYRSTSSGVTVSSANKINTTNVTTNSYTDSTVTNGTPYFYVVTAVDSSGNESLGSNEVSAVPQASSSTSPSSAGSSSGSSGGGSDSSSDEEDDVSEDDDSALDFEESAQEATAASEEISLPFLDTINHWAESYILKLYERGVVQGYDATTFGPNNNLTRAELSKIVVNLWGFLAPPPVEAPFSDVAVDAWYAGYIDVLKSRNILQGYEDGTFRPDQPINRAEALKILLEMLDVDLSSIALTSNPFTDVDVDAWYAPYVLYAYEAGYVHGYVDDDGELTGLFGPENTITRGEMSKIATLMLGL